MSIQLSDDEMASGRFDPDGSTISIEISEDKARTLAAQIVAQLRVIDGWHP